MIKYNLQKYSFTKGIVDLCNCLPMYGVKSPPVDSFRRNLDKFWWEQNVYCNYTLYIIKQL